MPIKLTNEQFISQLNKVTSTIHLVGEYNGRHHPTTFTCPHNHTWSALPNNILKGFGCPVCSRKIKKTTQQFEQELDTINKKRENKVFLCKGQTYVSSFVPLQFRCNNNHEWTNTPSNVINNQQGCKICAGKNKKTTQEFEQELKEKRSTIKIKEGEHYFTAHTKMIFLCDAGHEWSARPIDVLIGYGCPHCVKKGYSKKAIKWIREMSHVGNIQHAENGGEYLIPSTPFYADGYCKETNTIYEFYGDCYHGNPNVYSPTTRCHPYNRQLTAQQLYERTINREQLIKSLGYNIVTVWENDYDASTIS